MAEPALRRVDQQELRGPRIPPQQWVAYCWHTDQRWRRVRLIAWARWRGGWAVCLSPAPGVRDWRAYDPRLIHPQRLP